jgi:hypothetical protein
LKLPNENFKENLNSNSLPQKIFIGGYTPIDFSSPAFFAKKENKPHLSFKLVDIVNINGKEILKFHLKLIDKICRIMRYKDEKTGRPSVIFDIVDEEKKEIIFKSNKGFLMASQIGAYMVELGFINQWEIPPFELLTRAFLLGDKDTFLELANKYNLKMSLKAKNYIEFELE